MSRIIIFNILFLLLWVDGKAQTLPPKCSAYSPKVLNKTTIFSTDVKALSKNGYGQNGSTNRYWDVYSDRCDNVAYNGPSKSSGEATKLKFSQKVRIAQIQNGFALVYTENKPGAVNYPQISGDTKCYGWVPMENLLLWLSCPANEYGIYRKALITHNIDKTRDHSFDRVSQSPELSQTNNSNSSELKSSADVHYIMKEMGSGNGTRYLIATSNKLDGITDHVIEGWISKDSFIEWNYRTCLEPNWESTAVENFKKEGQVAYIYEDSTLIRYSQYWTYGMKNEEGQMSTQYRLPSRAMRFPLLDDNFQSKNTMRLAMLSCECDEMLHPFIKGKSQSECISYVGYISKEDVFVRDYWQIVVFISSEELIELIKKLEPIKIAAKTISYSSEDRVNYVNAVVGMVQSMTEKSPEEIEQMSTDEITRIIGGLNVSTSMLKGKQSAKKYTLSEIKNSKEVPDDAFRQVLRSMSTKIEDLSALPKSSNFKYTFIQNGNKFYWIPLEMIP